MLDGQVNQNQKFDEVFKAEINGWVAKNRKYRENNVKDGPKYEAFHTDGHPDPRNKLVGLAMSGGGTRSAIFNLGVTQALAEYGVMEQVDYMSTVSGGGYVGSSFTSLCADELPYPATPQGDKPTRLDMSKEKFPFAFPNPLAKRPGDNKID